MNLGQVAVAFPALSKLAQIDMDFKIAYQLHKLLGLMQSDVSFYSKKEKDVLDAHGTVDENNPTKYIIPTTDIVQTQKEINELRMLESSIYDTSIIKIKTTKGMQLSANDITALLPFVEFIEEEECIDGGKTVKN